MAILRFSRRLLLAALLLSSIAPGVAGAVPVAVPASPSLVVNVADDCYAIGQRVAAENGGRLGNVTASEEGGQRVCIVVVLVPPREGKKGQRLTIVEPQD